MAKDCAGAWPIYFQCEKENPPKDENEAIDMYHLACQKDPNGSLCAGYGAVAR